MSTMRSAIASRMMGDGSIGRRRRRSTFQTASQELAAEHKATRVLAVVFVCFFICWTPFFVTNFTLGFCGAAHCSIPPALASIFLWLGYFSSTINPVIYTIFNRRFREAYVLSISIYITIPLMCIGHLFSRERFIASGVGSFAK
jgi:hypothetical protein